jgi:biopolymer transport protein ExbB/TolQ
MDISALSFSSAASAYTPGSNVAALQRQLAALQKQLADAQQGTDQASEAKAQTLTQQIDLIESQITQAQQQASRTAQANSAGPISPQERDRRARERAVANGSTVGTYVDTYA